MLERYTREKVVNAIFNERALILLNILKAYYRPQQLFFFHEYMTILHHYLAQDVAT